MSIKNNLSGGKQFSIQDFKLANVG